MMSRKEMWIVAFVVALVASGQGMAQNDKEDKKKPIIDTGPGAVKDLRKWSIKREIMVLERSMRKYDPLIQSLGEANKDLKQDLQQYLSNPNDQVLASRITLKMSAYAKKITWDFDKIIGTQDILVNAFKELRRKLTKFSGYLDFKESGFEKEVKRFKDTEKGLRKELKKLAVTYKESEDPSARQKAKDEFRRMFRRFSINKRYIDGYGRNKQDYQALGKNLKIIIRIFSTLQSHFIQLIENLEAEKKFLISNIKLQADSLRVKKLVRTGIIEGNRAIKTISKKLAQLYIQVQGFAHLNQKINTSLSRFIDSQKVLVDVSRELEVGNPMKAAPTIEKAIDKFYKSRIDED